MQRQFAIGFQKIFEGCREKRIAIYGIGKNAMRVLELCKGFHFTAVAAKDHHGELFCGKKIVPLAEAVAQSDQMIIAATPQATKEVFVRIQPYLPAGYPVMDLHGHILTETTDAGDVYWEKTLEGLKREIDAHDVISFDIFDTLLMRKTLEPRDVFEIEERELQAQGEDVPFASWRPSAEIEQQKSGYLPNFEEIYRYLQERHGLAEKTVQRWKDREWALEQEVLVPRDDMVEALRYAKAQGKVVCLTSDMYFSKPEMEQLLAGKGVTGYDEIFVSCDHQATKGDGRLFRPLLELAGEQSVLHIGDNEIADDEVPRQLGIDTYGIRKAKDLFASSSCAHILENARVLPDRLMLGTILSHLFNSPFALAETKGKVRIRSAEEMAWLCFLPLTVRYLQFIVEVARENPDATLLFISRDGYFLQKVYASLQEQMHLPLSVYFYASRQAAYGAQVTDEEEIVFLLHFLRSMPQQNLRYQLEYIFQVPFSEEFDISVEDALATWGEDGIRSKVLACKEAILAKESEHRQHYLCYLESLHLERFQKIFCVDLLTKGTVPRALENILGRNVELIAMGSSTLLHDFRPQQEHNQLLFGILPILSPLHLWSLVMEVLYASREGQLKEFSADGVPVFVPHSEYNSVLLDHLQKGLLDGWKAFLLLVWTCGNLSESFCVRMVDLLDARFTEIADAVYDEFVFYDPGNSEMGKNYNILQYARKMNLEGHA